MESYIAAALLAVFIVVTVALSNWVGRREGYKEGQIDALNGEQNYKLLEFPDGTRDYYKEKEFKDFDDKNKDFKIIKPQL